MPYSHKIFQARTLLKDLPKDPQHSIVQSAFCSLQVINQCPKCIHAAQVTRNKHASLLWRPCFDRSCKKRALDGCNGKRSKRNVCLPLCSLSWGFVWYRQDTSPQSSPIVQWLLCQHNIITWSMIRWIWVTVVCILSHLKAFCQAKMIIKWYTCIATQTRQVNWNGANHYAIKHKCEQIIFMLSLLLHTI